jgi:hypothetical protein
VETRYARRGAQRSTARLHLHYARTHQTKSGRDINRPMLVSSEDCLMQVRNVLRLVVSLARSRATSSKGMSPRAPSSACLPRSRGQKGWQCLECPLVLRGWRSTALSPRPTKSSSSGLTGSASSRGIAGSRWSDALQVLRISQQARRMMRRGDRFGDAIGGCLVTPGSFLPVLQLHFRLTSQAAAIRHRTAVSLGTLNRSARRWKHLTFPSWAA